MRIRVCFTHPFFSVVLTKRINFDSLLLWSIFKNVQEEINSWHGCKGPQFDVFLDVTDTKWAGVLWPFSRQWFKLPEICVRFGSSSGEEQSIRLCVFFLLLAALIFFFLFFLPFFVSMLLFFQIMERCFFFFPPQWMFRGEAVSFR